jgi:hypothetical protein
VGDYLPGTMAPSHRATDRKPEEVSVACELREDDREDSSGRRAEVHDVNILALGFGGL